MGPIAVNFHEATAQRSALVARVELGEQVQVARRGVALARLMPAVARLKGERERFDALLALHRRPALSLDEVRDLFEGGQTVIVVDTNAVVALVLPTEATEAARRWRATAPTCPFDPVPSNPP